MGSSMPTFRSTSAVAYNPNTDPQVLKYRQRQNRQQQNSTWKAPTAMNTMNTPTQMEQSDLMQQMTGLASGMMSGEGFDPYRAASREALARMAQARRAATAAKIQALGGAGQGFARELASATDRGIRQQGFDSRLNTEMAAQNMKAQGFGMGSDIESMLEGARQNAAQNYLANRGLDLQGRSISNQAEQAANELALRRDQYTDQLMAQNEATARDDDYRKLALELQRELGNRELDISQGGLDIQRELGLGNLGLGQDELALRRDLGMGELGIAQDEMALNRELGLGGLDLQRELGLGQLGLGQGELDLNRELGTGQLALQNRQTDLDTLLGLGQLGLQNRAQNALESYQNMQMSLANRSLDADIASRTRELDLQFQDLSNRDKQVMAQIDLGRQEITQQDKQFMAQLGVSQQAQDWAEEFQRLQLEQQDREAERNYRLQNRQLDILETDPARSIQQAQYNRMTQQYPNSPYNYPTRPYEPAGTTFIG